jgi:phospho-N-acetylmuramoyl-pentapeptide-transferase
MMKVFGQYPTFSVFLALVIAAVVTLVLMPAWIKLLRLDNIGQQVRADGPESHLVKQGTPTMGGAIMLLAIAVATVAVARWGSEMWLLLAATLLTGLLGFVDDASKVIRKNTLGLRPRAKLVGQFALVIVFCLVAVNYCGVTPTVHFPFIGTMDLGVLTTTLPGGFAIPWLYLLFVSVLIAGMSNAVNLTDGLDGLAGGTVMVVMLFMAAIAYRSNMLDAAVFAAAIAGSCIGFLWFNSYPADIFMGDTGSLALGAALGCLAVVTKTEVVSLVLGGLFVAEALSVMIQVFYYKRTHRRLFLMAPLHHHFEKKGWSEVKVVIRFWIISGTLASIGFFLYFSESLMTMGV